jgi:ribosomal protein S18 acetylase RimI-like enzyme
MKLVRATATDLPELAALMNLAYRGTGTDAGWNSEAEAGHIVGERVRLGDLQAELAAKPDALLMLYREDGALRGSVSVEPYRGDIWWLGMLTVHPHQQDRGLGRVLLAAGEELAVAHGAKSMRMSVVNVRDTLVAWYERRGYRLTGETAPFANDDTRWGVALRGDLHFVVLEKLL